MLGIQKNSALREPYLYHLGLQDLPRILPGDDGTLMSGLELGHQFGLEPTSLLGVQVTDFFGDINETGDSLVVALLRSFFGNTAGSANLDGELLALGVSDEFA
jgi:hypothetical protein